jgi:predicted RecA/RadA family phage recombinase
MTTYSATGTVVDYTPGAAVAAGDIVIQGELFGIAEVAIPAATLGALAVEGIWLLPKAAGGSTAIAQGVTVYWDHDEDYVTVETDDGGDPAVDFILVGKVAVASVDADTEVQVLLTP